jgi:hypothetical protein
MGRFAQGLISPTGLVSPAPSPTPRVIPLGFSLKVARLLPDVCREGGHRLLVLLSLGGSGASGSVGEPLPDLSEGSPQGAGFKTVTRPSPCPPHRQAGGEP